jgi:FlaA1/EpsC-like NDP-sugar epimerase
LDSVCGKTVFISGGTGSLGNALVKRISGVVKKLIIFSRDEAKHANMMLKYPSNDKLRYMIGDVKDFERLKTALNGVDICIHAAAMKRIEACTYCPEECIKTNIVGSINVLNACIYNGVGKVLMISTDKACNPQTIYGSSKFTAEQLFINGNNCSNRNTICFCTRYGNVYGSNGSIRQLFKRQLEENGHIDITNESMTRFFMGMDQAVDLNLYAISNALGGEIFIPKLKAVKIVDFARVFFPHSKIKTIGLRGYEKMHEELISESEISSCVDCGEYYKIIPPNANIKNLGWNGNYPTYEFIKPFKYASNCVEMLSDDELIELESNY